MSLAKECENIEHDLNLLEEFSQSFEEIPRWDLERTPYMIMSKLSSRKVLYRNQIENLLRKDDSEGQDALTMRLNAAMHRIRTYLRETKSEDFLMPVKSEFLSEGPTLETSNDHLYVGWLLCKKTS